MVVLDARPPGAGCCATARSSRWPTSRRTRAGRATTCSSTPAGPGLRRQLRVRRRRRRAGAGDHAWSGSTRTAACTSSPRAWSSPTAWPSRPMAGVRRGRVAGLPGQRVRPGRGRLAVQPPDLGRVRAAAGGVHLRRRDVGRRQDRARRLCLDAEDGCGSPNSGGNDVVRVLRGGEVTDRIDLGERTRRTPACWAARTGARSTSASAAGSATYDRETARPASCGWPRSTSPVRRRREEAGMTTRSAAAVVGSRRLGAGADRRRARCPRLGRGADPGRRHRASATPTSLGPQAISASRRDHFPIVLGHETSGVIEAVGRRDSPCPVGDRVVVALTHHCGVCRYCERGQPVLCVHRDDNVRRLSRPDGSDGVAVLRRRRVRRAGRRPGLQPGPGAGRRADGDGRDRRLRRRLRHRRGLERRGGPSPARPWSCSAPGRWARR